MVKLRTEFICQKCNSTFPKWQGQCSQCGEWNTLVETVIEPERRASSFGSAAAKITQPLQFSQIRSERLKRIETGIDEFNRVLGGGIVPASLVLLAGEPGIGKSTLLSQLALNLLTTDSLQLTAIYYICGEESPAQIKLRLDRLVTKSLKLMADRLYFLPETNIESVVSALNQPPSPGLIIVDSIQTMWSGQLTGIAGSVGQVRYCSNMLLEIAKKTNTSVFLVGHVTKEGSIAGPKVLEHLVDTVLNLEGDKEHDFRILRAIKNRFGPTDEVGIFRMTDKGMEEVKNPSEVFLGTNSKLQTASPGSAITVTMQGIRPMLVEIQALVVPSNLAMPRRVASGVDFSRLQVIIAVLQKHLGLPLYQSDVFVSVAGGLKISEPAADLAIALSLYSSFKNRPLVSRSVCLGELGLLGEIRKVSFMEKRIKEAKKLGFKNIIGEKEKFLRQIIKAAFSG